MVNVVSEGLLDTNVFIHAQSHDEHSVECRRFLAAVEKGRVQARLDPIVLHELSYALRHYRKQMTKSQVAEYLETVLKWDGIQADKDLLLDTVERWRSSPGLAFVDAYLAALAAQRQSPVYSKNVRELQAQGVTVSEPLPG